MRILKSFKSFWRQLTHPVYQEYVPGKKNYEDLPEHLRNSLLEIPAVEAWGVKCYPCLAELQDNTLQDRLYIASAQDYASSRTSMVWPEHILRPGRSLLRIGDIKAIHPSPTRIPAGITQKIYAGGETSMGIFRFTLRFRDGSLQTYEISSSEIDFLHLPDRNAADIVEVILHESMSAVVSLSNPAFQWVLYGAGENVRKAWYGQGVKFTPEAKVRIVKS